MLNYEKMEEEKSTDEGGNQPTILDWLAVHKSSLGLDPRPRSLPVQPPSERGIPFT